MDNIETFNLKMIDSVSGADFRVEGEAICLCKEGLIWTLRLPSTTKALSLKVSTQPIEGYTHIRLEYGEHGVLVNTSNKLEKLYPRTSDWVAESFNRAKELWIKPINIEP